MTRQTETLWKYGQFQNVSLTMGELAKLKERFGELGAQEWLDTLSEQKEAHGYRYKSDYAAILAWARRQRSHEKEQVTKGEPLNINDQAQLIHRDLSRRTDEWECDRQKHHHTLTCQYGRCCSYTEDRRPRVPTLESILTWLRTRNVDSDVGH